MKKNTYVEKIEFNLKQLNCSEILKIYQSCHKSLPALLDLTESTFELKHAEIVASILNDKNNILKTLLIDWNKIMPRTTVYNIFSTIYSTNHPCLQNELDFRDLDAPSFKTENEDDGNEVSAADQLIACLENSTVLKSIALNIGEKATVGDLRGSKRLIW